MVDLGIDRLCVYWSPLCRYIHVIVYVYKIRYCIRQISSHVMWNVMMQRPENTNDHGTSHSSHSHHLAWSTFGHVALSKAHQAFSKPGAQPGMQIHGWSSCLRLQWQKLWIMAYEQMILEQYRSAAALVLPFPWSLRRSLQFWSTACCCWRLHQVLPCHRRHQILLVHISTLFCCSRWGWRKASTWVATCVPVFRACHDTHCTSYIEIFNDKSIAICFYWKRSGRPQSTTLSLWCFFVPKCLNQLRFLALHTHSHAHLTVYFPPVMYLIVCFLFFLVF